MGDCFHLTSVAGCAIRPVALPRRSPCFTNGLMGEKPTSKLSSWTSKENNFPGVIIPLYCELPHSPCSFHLCDPSDGGVHDCGF